jgi:hypothetical protein
LNCEGSVHSAKWITSGQAQTAERPSAASALSAAAKQVALQNSRQGNEVDAKSHPGRHPRRSLYSNEDPPRNVGAVPNKPHNVGATPHEGPKNVKATPYDGPKNVGATPHNGPKNIGATPHEGPKNVGATPHDGPKNVGATAHYGPKNIGVLWEDISDQLEGDPYPNNGYGGNNNVGATPQQSR